LYFILFYFLYLNIYIYKYTYILLLLLLLYIIFMHYDLSILDEIFKLGFFNKYKYLNWENILFRKLWLYDMKELLGDLYITSLLPGYKEGVSGSTVIGYNIGINENIDNEKKVAAIEALKFITSKNFQKKALITNNTLASGLFSLYEDEEVCEKLDCELFRSLQLIAKPIHVADDYDKYDIKYREYIQKFLFGDQSAKEVLKSIEDITKIYFLSLRTDDSKFGLFWFIFITVTIILIAFSLICIVIEKFTFYFKFLPLDFWIIIILGILLILSSSYVTFGPLSPFKCNLYILLISVGLTMIYVTILYKLIINLPEENRIIRKITKHRYLFLFFFLSIKFIEIIAYSYYPYNIETLIIPNGQNFQICSMKSFVGQFLIISDLFLTLVIILIISILIFAEWNLRSTLYDIRLIVISLYIDMIPIFLLVLVAILRINDYLLLYVAMNVLMYVAAIFKYLCLYGSKIILYILNKNSNGTTFFNRVALNYIENFSVTSTQITQDNTFSSNNNEYNRESKSYNNPIPFKKFMNENNKKSFISKIIYYHYISNPSSDNDTTTHSLTQKKANNFI